MRGNRMIMIKQLISLRTYHDIPVRSIGKGWLMIGGSTDSGKRSGLLFGRLKWHYRQEGAILVHTIL